MRAHASEVENGACVRTRWRPTLRPRPPAAHPPPPPSVHASHPELESQWRTPVDGSAGKSTFNK